MDNYLEEIFKKNIDKNKIKIILELGSRDLVDAIKLQKYYNCKVYAFECNPDCLNICKVNYDKLDDVTKKSINLIESAVSLDNGHVKFFPFDLEKYNNMGASSMLKIDFTKRNKWDPDYNRPNPQKEIVVPSIRLDTFLTNIKINNIDLLCIDLQGYELNALLSLGEEIKNVKYIIIKKIE
jgi:FkbM family methyltransferase